MDIEKRFLRGLLLLTAVAFVLFSLEFLFEWGRHGRPGLRELSYVDHNDNVKLVDVLSPTARAYNNMLAMLIAAVGLAIPLTANMHTPKLIEMFLRDRVNRIMLVFGALGASHVLWVAYLIGPEFAPMWAYRTAVTGAVLGWVFLIPYFFYVIRFLDPSNILRRLKAEVIRAIDQAERHKDEVGPCHDCVRDSLHQIAPSPSSRSTGPTAASPPRASGASSSCSTTTASRRTSCRKSGSRSSGATWSACPPKRWRSSTPRAPGWSTLPCGRCTSST